MDTYPGRGRYPPFKPLHLFNLRDTPESEVNSPGWLHCCSNLRILVALLSPSARLTLGKSSAHAPGWMALLQVVARKIGLLPSGVPLSSGLEVTPDVSNM